MVSRRRHDVRRNYICAPRRGYSTRTKGHFSVGEELPAYRELPSHIVSAVAPRLPRYSARGLWRWELYAELTQLVEVVWMNPAEGFVLNKGHVCASDGAEKSCRTRRRKRGLRKGKRRSRGRHPRRTVSDPANSSKPPSSRKVNHSGRKFIWAVKASNQLRKDCERYNKFPRGPLKDSHPAYRPRRNMKCYCLAKWTRLHKQAEAAGVPPVAAFHDSFWKYLLVETSRGGIGDWDMLLSGLPRKPTPEPVVESNPFAALFGTGLSLSSAGEITFQKKT